MEKLESKAFGPCWIASGTQGFFGEGYPFHRLPLIRNWYDFSGTTFVAKTTNYEPTKGNMRLSPNFPFAPMDPLPGCVWINWRKGMALNAIGLSGPGAKKVLYYGIRRGEWSKLQRPYQISFAPEGTTARDRLSSMSAFKNLLLLDLQNYPELRKSMGIQINLSCPNSDTNPNDLIEEAGALGNEARGLGLFTVAKVNLLMPVAVMKRIEHLYDAICLANTIPFGALPEDIPWKKWFPNGSPLKTFGGGGLSGAPLLPLVARRISEIKNAGIRTPINAGGGILKEDDVYVLRKAGLEPKRDSIFIGSVAMLRPWNIKSIIKCAHQLLS